MPESVLIRHEHGSTDNTLTLSNRAADGGIGAHLYQPCLLDSHFHEKRLNNTPYNPQYLQEARLLIVSDASVNYMKRDSESVVFATRNQLKALLDLSRAIDACYKESI